HLHSQLPIEKSTKSSCEILRKSVIGKTEVKTDCSPLSSRSWGSLSICRKRSYERRCTSMRLGIWMEVGILEKSRRLRIARFSDIVAPQETNSAVRGLRRVRRRRAAALRMFGAPIESAAPASNGAALKRVEKHRRFN